MTAASRVFDRRWLVLLGEGGVGKTSLAAAFGVALARRGQRTAVLTVDPAPRLATALGLAALDYEPQRITLAGGAGAFDAFRLDTKRTFDRIVLSIAPTAGVAHSILEHPIYRAISDSLGGSDTYMALQRLYELDHEADYSRLVIDTPPLANAAALFTAPARLAALIETNAPRVLANPALVVARAGSTIARTSARILLPLLERITGLALRTQLARFFENFEAVLHAMTDRAREVDEMLRAPETGFVAVCRPTSRAVAGLLTLARSLGEQGLRLDAVLVNRVTPPSEPTAGAASLPSHVRSAVERMHAAIEACRHEEARALAELERGLAAFGTPVEAARVYALDHEVADLADVEQLARSLEDALAR